MKKFFNSINLVEWLQIRKKKGIMTRENLFLRLKEEGIIFNEDMITEVFDYMRENLYGDEVLDVIAD